MMKIDVPLSVPKGVEFPEVQDKEQLNRWLWRHIQIPQIMYLITTVSEAGVPNCEVNNRSLSLGPIPDQMFAFICWREHHTAQNVLRSGEFVANIPSSTIGEAAWRTATPYPGDIDEITESGLTPLSSKVVKAPRIKECKIHLECQLDWHKEVGKDGMILFCGRIVAASGDRDVLTGDVGAKMAHLRPIFVMPWGIDTEKMKFTGDGAGFAGIDEPRYTIQE
jgi:flavin reductase (DIM6/NTAB) family NADH-FMN oxidoreductase RutF